MPREPSTWSTRDRAAYHRIDAARLRDMAEKATCSAAREVLVNLARHYRRVASKIEKRAVASAA
jgi:hypothetical protein